MWFTCLLFGFFLQDCAALPDRVGSFVIQSNGQDLRTCKREDGFEVCAWIERFELFRHYPKQKNAELYRGVSLIEGRSISVKDEKLVSFTFEYNGPQEFLSPSFSETHANQLPAMEAELDIHKLSSSYRLNFSKKIPVFFAFVEISSGASINRLITKATCGKHGEVRQGRFALLGYPDLETMYECMKRP
jgi:hypothetical protein